MGVVIVSCVLVYFLFPHPKEKITTVVNQSSDCFAEMDIVRTQDLKLAHPALLYDVKNQNEQFSVVKEKLNQLIAKSKASNGLLDISIYYRNLKNGAWFEINGGNTYNPASLMKVSYLITILKQAESNPSLLNKQVYFDTHFQKGSSQNIKNFILGEHKYYSMKELLLYMIAYSDNDATNLVAESINKDAFKKLYVDLSMPIPPDGDSEYFVSIIDFCKQFRVLYNSTYLRDDYSEFALDLLSKSTYKGALLKDLNNNFPVAHKFGERIINQIQQLHEAGIFYYDSQPYLLGVMSKGNDLNQLSFILSQISQIILEEAKKSNS